MSATSPATPTPSTLIHTLCQSQTHIPRAEWGCNWRCQSVAKCRPTAAAAATKMKSNSQGLHTLEKKRPVSHTHIYRPASRHHSQIWSIQSRFLLMSKLEQWPSGFNQNWAWQTDTQPLKTPPHSSSICKRAYTFHVLSSSPVNYPAPTLLYDQNKLIDSPRNPLFGLVQ